MGERVKLIQELLYSTVCGLRLNSCVTDMSPDNLVNDIVWTSVSIMQNPYHRCMQF